MNLSGGRAENKNGIYQFIVRKTTDPVSTFDNIIKSSSIPEDVKTIPYDKNEFNYNDDGTPGRFY